jgi:hypothetical protein
MTRQTHNRQRQVTRQPSFGIVHIANNSEAVL